MAEKCVYYLVLLGGTGAKCGEIFLHMCANGCFTGEEVYILYVDSDSHNGNAENFQRVYENYTKCREKYMISESPIPCFFKARVTLKVVNPVRAEIQRFEDLAKVAGGREDDGAIDLMKILYSEEEMKMEISDGFFAHPNVGAAVFAAEMDRIMEEMLKEIKTDKSLIKKTKVFILGSIFGGTGASSLPTISKYLRRKLFGESDDKLVGEMMKIGGCMVLPYFMFERKDAKGNTIPASGISVEANKFATKTKAALEYYDKVDNKDKKSSFESLYILGHDGNDVRGLYSTAGHAQRNLPHIVEFFAAMSAVDFFGSTMQPGLRERYFAVVPGDKIGWADVCGKNDYFCNFLTMMRFAFVMRSLILEEMFDYTLKNKLRPEAKDISWYYDFIDGKEKSDDIDVNGLYEKFEAISKYCDEYIRWFAELNLGNIYKRDCLENVEYERKDSDGSDVVSYLDIFSKELLIKQYCNIRIRNGESALSKKEAEKLYKKNLSYIRKHFPDLEQVHFYTDAKTEKIKMEEIWSRLSYSGYSFLIRNNDVFQNIAESRDKTMDSCVRNLVNAVFCSCLI